MTDSVKIDRRSLRKFPPLEDRFWEKVQKNSEDGCWRWTAALNENGYGVIRTGGKTPGNTLAHRLSYRIHYNVDPGDLDVCHRCDTPSCVNPNHLFLGTHKENMHDSINKGRMDPDSVYYGVINRAKTHCVNGHEFSEANTHNAKQSRTGTNMRQCRTCTRERMRKYRATKESAYRTI